MESKWVLCPLCGSKTRVKLLPETGINAEQQMQVVGVKTEGSR